ncbi:hypothetical protein NX059_006201 [Plenodomus lindquistii]|nr:hypothetical protein NX059_006201 [Plenodomus lindquistii]
MSLAGLTLRAKKSLSGLFVLSEDAATTQTSDEPVQCAQLTQCDKENVAPDLEEFGVSPQHREPVSSDTKAPSPSKSLSSRRKRLIGSLRRISSLRSIRTSPDKSKESDGSHPASPKSPRTPTRYMRDSLALDFVESQPGEPMFDLSKPRRSLSSSVIVHHSSPITVPSSSRQDTPFSIPIGPATLPVGTVPTTPGPFQWALECDATKKTPSPVFSSSVALNCIEGSIPTPMPGTNLTFEDIHPDVVPGSSSPKLSEASLGYFDIPVDDRRKTHVEFDQAQYNCAAARRASAEVLKDLIHDLDATTIDQPDVEIQHVLRKKPTFSCQGADRVGIKPAIVRGADEEIADEAHMEGIEHIVWDDETTMTNETGEVVPATDYALSADQLATGRSTEDSDAELEHRLQAWHTYAGLYDGSGYGGDNESTISRPSTSTYDTMETAPSSADTASVTAAKRKNSTTNSGHKATKAPSQASSDHETLEDVIRAYAVYDELDALSTADTDMAEDLDLARKIGA